MIQLPRPIGMPARLATYSASSRPCAGAAWLASAAGWPASAALAGKTADGTPSWTKTKNAAANAAVPKRQIGFGNTKADNGFSLVPDAQPGRIVLAENASFVWFCARPAGSGISLGIQSGI